MERCRETDGAGEECWCERGVSGVSGGGPAWDAGVDGVAGVVVVVVDVVVGVAGAGAGAGAGTGADEDDADPDADADADAVVVGAHGGFDWITAVFEWAAGMAPPVCRSNGKHSHFSEVTMMCSKKQGFLKGNLFLRLLCLIITSKLGGNSTIGVDEMTRDKLETSKKWTGERGWNRNRNATATVKRKKKKKNRRDGPADEAADTAGCWRRDLRRSSVGSVKMRCVGTKMDGVAAAGVGGLRWTPRSLSSAAAAAAEAADLPPPPPGVSAANS